MRYDWGGLRTRHCLWQGLRSFSQIMDLPSWYAELAVVFDY